MFHLPLERGIFMNLTQKVFNLIRNSLLITLLVTMFINALNTGKIFAFTSIVILGIVLGLLVLIYDIRSLSRGTQMTLHIIGSLAAIITVAVLNSWVYINWNQVLTIVLIGVAVALVLYLAYRYFFKKHTNNAKSEVTSSDASLDALHNTDQALEEQYAQLTQQTTLEAEEETAPSVSETSKPQSSVATSELEDKVPQPEVKADVIRQPSYYIYPEHL